MREFTKKDFDMGAYFSTGFDIFKKNAANFIVFTLVYFIIAVTINIIPFIGAFVNYIIGPALAAGFFILASKSERGEQISLADGFDGFKSKLPQFAILGLITLGTFALIGLVIGGSAFLQFFSQGSTDQAALAEYIMSKGVYLFVVMALTFMVVYLGFIYAPYFIYFEDMSPLDAIKASFLLALKNPVMLILFLFLGGLMAGFSILLLFVGILAGMPIFYISIYAAWKDQSGFEDHDEEKGNIIDNLV